MSDIKKCTPETIEINPEQSGGYSQLKRLKFAPGIYRPDEKSEFLLALNPETKKMQFLYVKGKMVDVLDSKPEKIFHLFQENEKKPFRDPFSFKSVDRHRKDLLFRIPSTKILNKAIGDENDRVSKRLKYKLEYSNSRKNKKKKSRRIEHFDALIDQCGAFFKANRDALLNEVIHDFGDYDAQLWSYDVMNLLGGRVNKKMGYDQIHIYHHLVDAKTEEARGYRYEALKQLSKLGLLFLDDDIWGAIDEGQSPAKAIADHWGVQKNTVKKMIKNHPLFQLKKNAQKYALWLDQVNPAHWPKNEDDLMLFETFMKVTDTYENCFNINKEDFIKSRIKAYKDEIKKTEGLFWEKVCFYNLKDYIDSVFSGGDYSFKTYYQKMLKDRSKRSLIKNSKTAKQRGSSAKMTVPQTLDDIPPYFRRNERTWDAVSRVAESELRHVQDMKNDIAKRILYPALFLEFERQGAKVSDASLLTDLSRDVNQKIWSTMSPSDQIAANSYWHSPNVNIRGRFQSVALGGTEHGDWPTLWGDDTPFDLGNGIFLHPLNSQTLLDQEADAMKRPGRGFCIASYGSRFYTSNFHLMSIRDSQGERLCSLTIQDYFDEDKKRKVRYIENKGPGNSEPPEAGKRAARKIMELINSGKLPVDWTEIDQARTEYKVRQVENAAGYDIRNVDTRQNVFEVYISCLPKRLVKQGKSRLEGFMEAINLSKTVENFIESYDFSEGGLTNIKDNNVAIMQNAANQNEVYLNYQREANHG